MIAQTLIATLETWKARACKSHSTLVWFVWHRCAKFSLYILFFFALVAKLRNLIIFQCTKTDDPWHFFVLTWAEKSSDQAWILPASFVFHISVTGMPNKIQSPKTFLEMKWWLSVGLHTHQVKEFQLALTSIFLRDVEADTVFKETGNTLLFRQGRHYIVIKIVDFLRAN